MDCKMQLISVGVAFGFSKIKGDRYVPVMPDLRCSTHLPTMITSTLLTEIQKQETLAKGISAVFTCLLLC